MSFKEWKNKSESKDFFPKNIYIFFSIHVSRGMVNKGEKFTTYFKSCLKNVCGTIFVIEIYNIEKLCF